MEMDDTGQDNIKNHLKSLGKELDSFSIEKNSKWFTENSQNNIVHEINK